MCQHERVCKKPLRQTSNCFVGPELQSCLGIPMCTERGMYKAMSILLLLLVVNRLPQQPNINRKKDILT